MEGEAVAEGVCPKPPPAPKVNPDVEAGAVDPLVPNPLPGVEPNPPLGLLLAPNANGAGLADVAGVSPFD